MTTAPHVSYDTSGPSVAREELEAFAGGLLQAVGMDLEDADFTARTLVHADLRGVHSHGVRMLPLYVRTLSERLHESQAHGSGNHERPRPCDV